VSSIGRKKDKNQKEYSHPLDIRSNPEHQGMLKAMFEKIGAYTVKETSKPPYIGKDNNYELVEG